MEPGATMAFAISLTAINLVPLPIDDCVSWRTEQPEQRLCVQIEEPCVGKECGVSIAKTKKPYKKWYTSKKTGKKVYRTVWR